MMLSASPLHRAASPLAVAAGLLLVASAATAASKVNVLGTVGDAAGDPVAAAHIELLDAKGNVVAAARTGERGDYALPCVEQGTYTMRLTCPDGCGAGEDVAAPVGPEGLTVRWTVDHGAAPIGVASASGGACSDGGGAAAGAGAGGAAGAGGSGSGSALAGSGGGIGGAGIAAAAGGGAVVIGGTLGGLAASGAFDGGSKQTGSE